jgi:hypothetical protein
MSRGFVYTHARLQEEELQRLIASLCEDEMEAFLYNQAIDDLSLTLLGDDLPALAPEGRVFNSKAEVRWQQHEEIPGEYLALILSEKHLGLESSWVEQEFDVNEPLTIYLMGVWQPQQQAWIEVRIPHPLDYPLEDPGRMERPVAKALEYSRDGIVQYIRFLDLTSEPLKEASNA